MTFLRILYFRIYIPFSLKVLVNFFLFLRLLLRNIIISSFESIVAPLRMGQYAGFVVKHEYLQMATLGFGFNPVKWRERRGNCHHQWSLYWLLLVDCFAKISRGAICNPFSESLFQNILSTETQTIFHRLSLRLCDTSGSLSEVAEPQSNLQSPSCKHWIHILIINRTPLASCYRVSYFLFKSYLGCIDYGRIADAHTQKLIQSCTHTTTECIYQKYATVYVRACWANSVSIMQTGPTLSGNTVSLHRKTMNPAVL